MSRHKSFSFPVRVYYQDTDAGGVMYHASYVNFFERGRTEWLRSYGYSNAALMKEMGVMFVVRSIKLDYLKPAQLDDLLDVEVEIRDVGRTRLTLLQKIRRNGDLLTEGEVHLVCVEKESFKPVSVPDIMRNQWKD